MISSAVSLTVGPLPLHTGTEMVSVYNMLRLLFNHHQVTFIRCVHCYTILVTTNKFTAPRIDDTPAKCNEKIAQSTDAPARAILLACFCFSPFFHPSYCWCLFVNPLDRKSVV
jgi:hypothetical protein